MKRLESIQGLRAIAIIMVFLAHTESFIDEELIIFSDLGELGVYIFIVISGVLLAISEKKFQHSSLSENVLYALKKLRKLYWLHVLTWSIVLVITWNDMSLVRKAIYSIFNLTLTQDWIPFSGIINSFNGPSWYLSMCLFIWIMTPRLVNRFDRLNITANLLKKLIFGVTLGLIAWINLASILIYIIDGYIPMINSRWIERWILYSCPVFCFIIYSLSFLIYKYDYLSHTLCNNSHIKWICAGIIIITLVTKGEVPVLGHIPFIIAVALILTLVINADHVKGIMKVLCNPVLVALGNLSSYIFLIHGVVNCALVHYGGEITTPYKFIVSAVITIVLSAFVKNINDKIKRHTLIKKVVC